MRDVTLANALVESYGNIGRACGVDLGFFVRQLRALPLDERLPVVRALLREAEREMELAYLAGVRW